MAKKKKFYVVWEGRNTGIYDSWEACANQVKGIAGAKYKSFDNKESAEKAFTGIYENYIEKNKAKKVLSEEEIKKYGQPNTRSIAVDAACSGNPGKMEYQGVFTDTGTELFHFGPVDGGTNNIGEFLALVHGLAWLKKEKLDLPIYSDSRIAISWVKNKKCRTKLPFNAKTQKLFDVIKRAESWLKENKYATTILKWETKVWGEIPADFGRK